MFKLNQKYENTRNNWECDYIRYSPSKISTKNTSIFQIFINIPREDSVMFLLNSYLDLYFDVPYAATGNKYRDGNDIRLVNLGAIALFSNYMLTTISGKHFEDFSNAHIVSLMYKLLPSAKGSDDLSIGFDWDQNRGKLESSNNKKMKGENHARFHSKNIFDFAKHQEKATFRLAYKLSLLRKNDYSVLNKDNAINISKIKIDAFEWYVPQYTPVIPQQAILSKQILSDVSTELQ